MLDTVTIDRFLTAIYQDQFGHATRLTKRFAVTALHPVVAWAALRYVGHFPIVTVNVPKTDRSKAPWMYDSRRPWRLRGYVSSFIELPTPLDLYWQGQAKQNLRKATGQARAAGFSTRSVPMSEVNTVIEEVLSDSGWQPHEIRTAQLEIGADLDGAVFVAVFDERDRAVAFCFGLQAGNVVRNLRAYTSQRGAVRWLCFSAYVQEVNARGGRFIIESPPWAFTKGNDVFAQRLGFAPARIRSSFG